MSTLRIFAPAVDSSTRTATPAIRGFDPGSDDAAWDEVVSLPRIETPGRAFLYYFDLAWHGLECGDLSHLDLDLVEWARDGYRRGADERDAEIAARLLADAPTDAEIAAPTDPMPSPEELAAELRRVDADAVVGEGPVADFLRAALASLAADVEIFRARTWEELDGRMNAMAAGHGEIGGVL